MGELRKDYFTNKFSLINKEELSLESYLEEEKGVKPCPLCPGKEENLPPAEFILYLQHGTIVKTTDDTSKVKDWKVRMIPNLRSPIKPTEEQVYGESPLYSEPAYGYDYLLIATPNHDEKFHKMGLDQWTYLLISIQDRMKDLLKRKRVAYVAVSITQGKLAGALYDHPYCRIVTLPRLPIQIEEEAKTVNEYRSEKGSCIMCDVVRSELGGPRHIISTDNYFAFCPWAPTHDYEYWIFPSKHQTEFPNVTQKEIMDLAKIVRATLGALAKIFNFPSFNLIIHTSPEKKITKKIDWHIEVYPVTRPWGELERGVKVYEILTAPEKAAEKLRYHAKREFAQLTLA